MSEDEMSEDELNNALAEVLGIPREEFHIVCAYNEEKIRKLTEAGNE